jgi:hypothetical protein
MLGRAADIVCKDRFPYEVAEAAEEVELLKNGGIGRYETFTHVDVRGEHGQRRGDIGYAVFFSRDDSQDRALSDGGSFGLLSGLGLGLWCCTFRNHHCREVFAPHEGVLDSRFRRYLVIPLLL